jgi:hypothetical protein
MTTFYNETSLNGKYQVRTTETLTGKGIRQITGFNITEHKGQLFKGLNEYWVTKKVLETIKENNNVERVCF